jgi:protein O-mannosyl-transferase
VQPQRSEINPTTAARNRCRSCAVAPGGERVRILPLTWFELFLTLGWMSRHGKSPADEPALTFGLPPRRAKAGPPDDDTANLRFSARWDWVLGLLLIAATLLAYAPAWHAGFIWDDDRYVTENPMLTAPDGLNRIWFSAHHQSQYFPLTYTTFKFERALWGLNPMGYHGVNLLLHGLNALLVWILLRRLEIPGAWLAAALWALHPVQVESVAWITELKNTQSAFFCLLAVLSWLRFADQQTTRRCWYYGGALLLQAMALFSKTTACTLPAALLLVLWWRGETIGWRRIGQVLPFLFLGVTMGLVSVWWEGHMGNYQEESGAAFGGLERLLIASRALWFYAGKLLWPASLTFSYPKWEINAHEPMQYTWLIGCGAVAGLLWWQRKGLGRGVIAGVMFFVATLSPLLGFIWLYTFRFSFVADHYQYVASLGLLALAGAAVHSLCGRLGRGRPFVKPVVYGALLLGLGGLTWRQCGTYADVETLWRTTLAKNPICWLAHNNLGNALAAQGKVPAAMPHYERALQLNPDYPEAHSNLGSALIAQGRLPAAVQHFETALRLNPTLSDAWYNLGNALAAQGKLTEAIDHYERALQLKPGLAPAHVNLGSTLSAQGKWTEAIQHYERALQLKPGLPVAHVNLAGALAAQGNSVEAIQHLQQALELATAQANPALAEGIRARLKDYQSALQQR